MKKTKSKKISLVTGGAGFIGSHVADHLLKMNHKVIVLDDLSGGMLENVNKNCIFIRGSIVNGKLLNKIFKNYKIDYVFHLAAYAAEGLSHFIRKFNYRNNIIGSINLINRSVEHKIKRFVYASSIAVYGTNQLPMVENLDPKPEDPYGIAKYAVELDLKAASKIFDLDYTIFRLHNVYGERQNYGDFYRNVIGIFINNILKGKPIAIFGDGKQTRAFSYISDVAQHIAKSAEMQKTKNEIFNLGADNFNSVLDLAEILRRVTGIEARIVHLPPRREVMHAYAGHSKAKKAFNIRKTVGLETGIRKMYSWAKSKGPLNAKKFKEIELSKNMPPSWKKLT